MRIRSRAGNARSFPASSAAPARALPAAPGSTRSSSSCGYSNFRPRSEYAAGPAFDRAQVENVAAVSVPDIVGDVRGAAERTSRSFEIGQRRGFEDYIVALATLGRCLSKCSLKALRECAAPLAEVEQFGPC